MGEAIAVDALCATLKNALGNISSLDQVVLHKGVISDHEVDLKRLFSNASKKGTEKHGFPDVACMFQKTLIVCECKRKRSEHMPKGTDPLCEDNPQKFASSGVLHYMKCAHAKNPHLDIIGVAYTQETTNEVPLVNIYSINHRRVNSLRAHEHSSLQHLGELMAELRSIEIIFDVNARISQNSRISFYAPSSNISRLRTVPRSDPRYFQRFLNKDRARCISELWIKQKVATPGGVTLGVLDGDIFVVDGQHRVEACRLLTMKDVTVYLPVEVIWYKSLETMKQDFAIMNMAESHTDLDRMLLGNRYYDFGVRQEKNQQENGGQNGGEQGNGGQKDEEDEQDVSRAWGLTVKHAVTMVCEYVAQKGGALVQPNCESSKRPFVSKKNMRSRLEEHVVSVPAYRAHRSTANLVSYLKKQIDALNSKYKRIKKINAASPSNRVTMNMRKKSDQQGFYLGLVMREEWVDEL